MKNQIEFKVYGKTALFTDPISKISGEKYSYHIPTYEAIKGIVKSIYWKPTFIWYIDKVRIINPIKIQSKNIKTLKYGGGNDLSIYTYLINVEYQVQAHFEWNLFYENMKEDRISGKHYEITKRMINKGGRRDIFLGSRECQAYIEPCNFGEGKGTYDDSNEDFYGLMFHGFDYPDETGNNKLYSRFWRPIVKKGIIEFIPPEKCKIRKFVREMFPNFPKSEGLKEKGLLNELD